MASVGTHPSACSGAPAESGPNQQNEAALSPVNRDIDETNARRSVTPPSGAPAPSASTEPAGSPPPPPVDSQSTIRTQSATDRIPISISVRDFSVSVKNKRQTIVAGWNRQSDIAKDRRVDLLSQVSLRAVPGQLYGILGPSGCGKTTLLNVIVGRARGRKTGEVLFNGAAVKFKDLRGQAAMLYANDRMMPFLTVEETLMFTAFLKMAHTTAEIRRERVNQVLEELSLVHVRDTLIGGTWRKGVSSGELRRTSIAQVLIGNPSALILDEPTSGLDAVLAYEVTYVLKRLAKAGRTIVCTLHQPRSSAFRLLDQLMIMSAGRVLYGGPGEKAQPFVHRSLGIDLGGRDQNMADALLDIASAVREPSEEQRSGTTDSKRSGNKVGQGMELADAYAVSPEMSEILRAIDLEKENATESVVRAERHWWAQVTLETFAVAYRSFRNSIRNPLTLGVTCGIQIVAALLLGGIFFDMPGRYLPEAPPSGAFMKDELDALFSSVPYKFIASGMDGEFRNPLVDMLVEGIDGNGSSFLPVFNENNVMPRLMNAMPCIHTRLGLDTHKEYSNTNFSKYDQYWDGYNTSSMFDNGALVMPELIGFLLDTLQAADYAFNQSPWLDAWKICRDSSGWITWPVCYACSPQLGHILNGFAECVGLPMPPIEPGVRSPCDSITDIDPDDVAFPPDFALESNWPHVAGGKPPAAPRAVQDISYFPFRKPRIYDREGVADRGSAQKRQLQAGAVLGSQDIQAKDVIPAPLLQLGRTAKEYTIAFQDCEHPLCRKIVAARDQVENVLSTFSLPTSDFGQGTVPVAAADGPAPPSNTVGYLSVVGCVMNLAGALFFSVANGGFASYEALIALSEERVMFNRECVNRLYRPWTYFLGKNIADLFFQIIPLLCSMTIFFFMVGLDVGPKSAYFWRYVGINLCGMFASFGFAYGVAAICPNLKASAVAAPLLMLVLLCVSGFFVRDDAIPPVMVWSKWISMYRWGFFGVCLNSFPRGRNFFGLPNDFSLAVIGVPETTTLGQCIGFLLALGLFYRIIAWAGLRFCHRRLGVEQ